MTNRPVARWLAFVSIAVLMLAAAGPVQGKDTKRSYIVVLDGAPIGALQGAASRMSAAQGTQRLAEGGAGAKQYKQKLKASHDASLKAAGASTSAKVHDYTYGANGYSAILTKGQAQAISTQKGVLRVMEDQMRKKQTDSSGEFLGLTARGGPYATGFKGQGVVIGVIDTGIWPEHPSFKDNGSYPEPHTGALPCDFGNTAHNPDDKPFTCNNKLVGAYQMLDTYRALIGADPDEFDSARDDDGHGTHTASTAAGNAGVRARILDQPVGTISGIAPRAQIVAYKALGNLGGFTSDLAAAIDQATFDGVDVINYSIGGGAGAPGLDDIMFLFAADAGIFVATSAGNEGPGPETVGSPAVMPWLTTVGASTQTRFFEGVITLGNGKRYVGASITKGVNGSRRLVDAADAGSEVCAPGELDAKKVKGAIVLCKRGEVDRIQKSLAVQQAGGVGMIQYNPDDTDNLFTDTHWVPSVHVDGSVGLKIKHYIDRTHRPTARIETKTRKGAPLISRSRNAPTMTGFSSRGPNAVVPDLIKPDVTAPGLQILAGASPFPDEGAVPGELFQAIAGTSMSSPHVAGVFALLKQAHPEWTAAMAKSALMTTASQDVLDNDRIHRAGPFAMGAGHIEPGGKWAKKGSVVQPGLVYDAGLFEYAAFTCGQDFQIFDQGSCDFLEANGIPSAAIDLNLPSIGISEVAGSRTITRTVTSVTSGKHKVTYRADVKAPKGYKVTVSPRTLRLAGGESATFTVTVENRSAPVGEWRFGSLTWDGDAYQVRSPIAVKAALFDAPGEVSGTGASGTTSFDVTFGYDGSYTAAAHGLIQSTLTQDNVLQDPDQTFDPSDVDAGGANVHEFTLTDAAFFRIVIPPGSTDDPDADLDVFVFDPTGEEVASSTAGGTDEQVDIVDPMDGTWRVYVHGWAAPGGDTNYDMWSWAVPASPGGGSLTIADAPTSASSGAVGTVTASWSGLGTGGLDDWYLGAVSHTGPDGLMGATLVNVDNRP